MGFQFRDGEGAAEGARRIAREQIGRAIEGLEAGASGPGGIDEVVHEARKRIKKARAMIRLARPAIGPKEAGKADRRLRDAARPLSDARDASALASVLEDLAGAWDGPSSLDALDQARRALADRRGEVARRVLDEGDALARAAAALRDVRRRLKRWEFGDDSHPAPALKPAYKRARAAFDTASADLTPGSLHEWRKRVKDLAYQLRALGGDADSPAARLRRLAELLAAELGEVHDLDVLRDALPPPTLGALGPAIDRRRDDLRRVVFQRGGAIFLDRPRAFARRLAEPARAD